VRRRRQSVFLTQPLFQRFVFRIICHPLLQDHIEPESLMVAGFAYYRPVAPNDSPENRQRNRRVEIILSAPERS
jgi:hypothetical protein